MSRATAPPGPPYGFVVELGRRVRVYDGGRTLVGGAPVRLLRLNRRAAALLHGRRVEVTDRLSQRLAERLLAVGAADPVVAELPPVDLSRVTVVVPVRDRAAALDRLLTGLAGRVRAVVVDDCSDDPRAVARVAARHGAELVALHRNLGPAGARNAGLAKVGTPFAAFVDSDVVVAPEALATLLRHFHHPRVAAAAPRILGLPGRGEKNWISRYEDARSSLDLGPEPALVHPRSAVSWVPSACLVARVDALGGGFTDGMRVAEDVDLVWRLAARGWQVRYEPAATARHDHRTRLADWLRRKAYYGTGAHPLALRHGALVAPAVLTPWSAAAAAAVLAQRRWSVPVAAGAAAVAFARLSRTVSGSGRPRRLAADLVRFGLLGTAGQTSALLLRHWWPLSLAACLFSRRARRAVAVAAVADGVAEYLRVSPGLDPVRFVLARRLDDLAYGAGVWAAALRAGSLRSLLPDFPGVPRSRGGSARTSTAMTTSEDSDHHTWASRQAGASRRVVTR
ncbi:putative glycosyltransferase [Actinomadura sp. NBRC 104425]|uniref:mycofactocin biosynthesis glycosyltransferase MftF n=1 Tax=Actinomadura sp. NBRC 104425 TaxID=3032204 RepID=UPI00249FDB2D|nr:mycofactocin biosynthesis glycosyltransferase MftF [Actinomadura sp. NBRC 104425]GLZ11477.1 putative glycosyltransferase [Actinomadura sp. NBRC 104425]